MRDKSIDVVVSQDAWDAIRSITNKYDIRPSEAILKMHQLWVAAQGVVGNVSPPTTENQVTLGKLEELKSILELTKSSYDINALISMEHVNNTVAVATNMVVENRIAQLKSELSKGEDKL